MTQAASCGPTPTGANKCSVNMGLIHLQAGDLVSAYRFFLPMAEQGDAESIDQLIEICERGGDTARADSWRERRAAVTG